MIWILKYWKPLVLALLLIAAATAWHTAKQRAYQAGYQAATAKISADLAKAHEAQQQRIDQAAGSYQAGKTERDHQERIRYVEVQKIINRPVYRNVCLDDDGLRQLNAAIADGR